MASVTRPNLSQIKVQDATKMINKKRDLNPFPPTPTTLTPYQKSLYKPIFKEAPFNFWLDYKQMTPCNDDWDDKGPIRMRYRDEGADAKLQEEIRGGNVMLYEEWEIL